MRTVHSSRGFTLTELAVVLIIVGLLLGGLFVPLSAQTDMKARSDNSKTLADVRDALIGFAVINGRLPCPADRIIASGTANAGIEATTTASGICACTTAASGIATSGGVTCSASPSVTGVLPWATLGLPETDSWGNRYTYRVTTLFAQAASGQTTATLGCSQAAPNPNPNPPTPPTNVAFALCSPGNITILDAAPIDVPPGVIIANNIPAIVLSHGKNVVGAYLPTGNVIPTLVTTSNAEVENANGDATFVSNSAIDDQVIWITPNLLMNRMMAAGKLP